MLLRALDAEERVIVLRALQGSLTFLRDRYDDAEYSIRMGLDPEEVIAMIATLTATADLPRSDETRRAVNGSFNELLNGVGITEVECMRALGVTRAQAEELFEKWRLDMRRG